MASHWFDWRNADVHYHKSGWGDPLLLVHDLYGGASSEEFDRNVRFLNSQFTVYRLDLLGFGFSQSRSTRYRASDYAALIGDFIEQIIGGPAHIVAVGRSCGFAAAAAAETPRNFANLVFISAALCSVGSTSSSWDARLVREIFRLAISTPPVSTMFRSIMSGSWELSEFLRRTIHNPRCIDASMVERLEELAREPHTLAAYASLEAGFLSMPLEQFLPRLKSPALFIRGAESDQQHRDAIDRCVSLTSRGAMAQIPGARLWPHYEQPRQTNPLLAEFLNASGLLNQTAPPSIAA